MYDLLVLYLKEKDIRLENYMFPSVLNSLNKRINGDSARSANGWARTTKLIERYSTSNDEEVKE